MPDILTTIVESPVPVIARVNGHARAGGLGLIAACDMAVAPESSTFAFTEVRVGVAPAMIMVPALRVMDRRFLARMTLTGERFGAPEADGRRPPQRGHAPTATRRSTTGWPTQTTAIRQGGTGRRPGHQGPAAQPARDSTGTTASRPPPPCSADLFAGAEAAEGMEAFLQKRRPSWDTTE